MSVDVGKVLSAVVTAVGAGATEKLLFVILGVSDSLTEADHDVKL